MYRSSSFQTPRVIDGQGWRHTSSPTWPRTDRPVSSTTSPSTPSDGPPSEQLRMDSTGYGARNDPPTSVPPEKLITGTRPPNTSRASHSEDSGSQGSPVDPSTCTDDKSVLRMCPSSVDFNARARVGDTPSMVTRWRSTSRHSRLVSGLSCEPPDNRR